LLWIIFAYEVLILFPCICSLLGLVF
jgi:hypothetical protein